MSLEVVSNSATNAQSISSGDTAHSVHFDSLYIGAPRRWLALMLVLYLCLAILYAVLTPNWQAPDEPAHYNYIRYIVENRALPLLRMGDFDSQYNSAIVTRRFPENWSIDPFRYEYYQPPLYYITVAPAFFFSQGSLLFLRVVNIVFGFFTLLLLYLALETVFPNKPLITLGALAFAAFLPMHVAVTASVNNDVFANFLLVAATFVLLRWMRGRFYDDGEPTVSGRERIQLLLLGFLLGLGLITKIYAYAVLPLAVGVVIYTIWSRQRAWSSVRAGAIQALWVILPGLILGFPIWFRNILLYGLSDPLALKWHDQVVVNQVRTSDYIAQEGSLSYFERAFSHTFQSFWGVFGWMGVFMDERIYTATLIVSGALFLGLLWATVRLISGRPDTDMDSFQVTVLCIMGCWLVLVALGYVWYNLKFVQHQGRYFFWGILAISALAAVAWRELLYPLQGVITGMLGAVLALSLFVTGALTGSMSEWTIVIVSALSIFLLLQPFLLIGLPVTQAWTSPPGIVHWVQQPAPSRLLGLLRIFAWAAPFLLLLLLCLAAPFLYIAPQLRGS